MSMNNGIPKKKQQQQQRYKPCLLLWNSNKVRIYDLYNTSAHIILLKHQLEYITPIHLAGHTADVSISPMVVRIVLLDFFCVFGLNMSQRLFHNHRLLVTGQWSELRSAII